MPSAAEEDEVAGSEVVAEDAQRQPHQRQTRAIQREQLRTQQPTKRPGAAAARAAVAAVVVGGGAVGRPDYNPANTQYGSRWTARPTRSPSQ